MRERKAEMTTCPDDNGVHMIAFSFFFWRGLAFVFGLKFKQGVKGIAVLLYFTRSGWSMPTLVLSASCYMKYGACVPWRKPASTIFVYKRRAGYRHDLSAGLCRSHIISEKLSKVELIILSLRPSMLLRCKMLHHLRNRGRILLAVLSPLLRGRRRRLSLSLSLWLLHVLERRLCLHW